MRTAHELALCDWRRFSEVGLGGWGDGRAATPRVQALLDRLDGGEALASEQAYIEAMRSEFPVGEVPHDWVNASAPGGKYLPQLGEQVTYLTHGHIRFVEVRIFCARISVHTCMHLPATVDLVRFLNFLGHRGEGHPREAAVGALPRGPASTRAFCHSASLTHSLYG